MANSANASGNIGSRRAPFSISPWWLTIRCCNMLLSSIGKSGSRVTWRSKISRPSATCPTSWPRVVYASRRELPSSSTFPTSCSAAPAINKSRLRREYFWTSASASSHMDSMCSSSPPRQAWWIRIPAGATLSAGAIAGSPRTDCRNARMCPLTTDSTKLLSAANISSGLRSEAGQKSAS